MAVLTLTVFLAYSFLRVAATDFHSTEGTKFVFSYLGHSLTGSANINFSLYLSNNGNDRVHYKVRGPGPAQRLLSADSVEPKSVATILIDQSYEVFGPLDSLMLYPQKGIVVTSTRPISVAAGNRDIVHYNSSGTADVFTVLPVTQLGTLYYTVSSGGLQQADQFNIVSSQESTNVNISGGPFDGIVSRLLLRAEEVLSYASRTHSLAGVKITSDKPVAVTSGTRCGFVPPSHHSCDHQAEMLLSNDKWGLVFPAAEFDRNLGNLFQLTAAEDATVVSVAQSGNHHPLNAGEFVYWNLTRDIIMANKPIQVVQYGHSWDHEIAPNGDAFLTHVAPTTHFISGSITFTTPDISMGRLLRIITNDTIRGHFTLDRQQINGTSGWLWLGGEFYVKDMPIEPGTHHLECRSTSGKYTVVVYGFSPPIHSGPVGLGYTPKMQF